MRRKFALLLGLLVCSRASFIEAHDFWLQPSEYWIDPDTLDSMTLQVGHGPFRQRSPIPLRRITRFQAIAPNGMAVDLHQRLRLGQGAEDGDFRLNDPGTYVLVLQTDDGAQTHLPAIRFNDYLKVEGLTPALEQRARLQRMDADGSERYSRCAKSIVQVGQPRAGLQGQVEQAGWFAAGNCARSKPLRRRSVLRPSRFACYMRGMPWRVHWSSSPISRMTLHRSKCV